MDGRYIPARLRPGRWAWLGPAAVTLGLLSWLLPVLAAPVAGVAVVCGAVSLGTDRRYRIDWMAVAGVLLGVLQLVVSVLLVVADNTT